MEYRLELFFFLIQNHRYNQILLMFYLDLKNLAHENVIIGLYQLKHLSIHKPYLSAIALGVGDIHFPNEDSKSLHHIKD